MTTFKLDLRIDPDDARELNETGQRITLIKEVGGDNPGTQVAWVVFDPFEKNTVTWESSYGVYASTTQVQNSATIDRSSVVNPAAVQQCYPFRNGVFCAPTGISQVNTYGVKNFYTQKLTFGLAQSVVANDAVFDTSPLNAVPVLSQYQALFTPIERVKVFLHASFDNGVILTDVSSVNSVTVDLTRDPSAELRYSSDSGSFVLV